MKRTEPATPPADEPRPTAAVADTPAADGRAAPVSNGRAAPAPVVAARTARRPDPAPLPAAAPASTPAGVLGPRPTDPVDGFHFVVVPHTHWDREWYLPFEQMRMRLARTVDEICDVLETDPRFSSFTLDGQSVILEDYAEIRPRAAVDRLRRLIAEGRIVTGPSYVLPDEFLAGQESLVRNLLIGRRIVEEFGGAPMGVGYMPDTFGHVAQLPQILRGFGLDSFVFWRGLGDEAARVGLAFAWQAPDGSTVTAIRQLGSYGNGAELGRWAAGGTDLSGRPGDQPDAAAHRFVRQVETWAAEIERTGTRELFLGNGSDHLPIHRPLPDLLERARQVHPGAAFEIGSLDDYWARLRPTLGELPVVRGELVGGRDAPVLRGINSARIPLKQASARTEAALLMAETLAALAALAGRYDYPAAELDHAWRQQLRNLPHDSISGCSVDEVHRDMAQRFHDAQEIADRVRREALAALAGRREPWSYRPVPAATVSLVNPLPHARTGVAEIPLPDALVGAGTLVALPGVVETGSSGRAVASAIPADALAVQVAQRPSGPVALVAAGLGGFASRHLTLATVDAEALPDGASIAPGADAAYAARATAPDTVENGRLRVTAHPDGSLTVVDLASGAIHERLNVLEDVADRGDEYNFCPLEPDRPIAPAADGTVRVGAPGPVVAELVVDLALRLPERLSPDRRRRVGSVDCPVRVVARLAAGSERLEIATTVDNRAEDHRLRVRFAAAGADHATLVRAEGHYDVVRRPARPVWTGAGWIEPPALTAHTSGFVAAGDLVVVGQGLPEYEAVPTNAGLELALTLLRCVGWLSRDDLATRPGGAGPQIATPEAQCPGRHTLEYAVAFGGASLDDAALCRMSAEVRVPLAVGPAGAFTDGLVAVDGEVAFAALKGAEDGDGAILRLYRPGTEGCRLDVRSVGQLSVARLDESATRDDPLAPLMGGEIRTIRIRRD